MKTVIFLGAPGSGKGTIAGSVKDAAGMVHISTGDLLRNAVKNGTAVGVKADEFMKRGELVPDAVILGVLEDRLDDAAAADSFIMDGFPRTLEQARMLDESLGKRDSGVDLVVFLDAVREVLINRLTGRRTCRKCGAGFHLVNIPPKQEGVCDKCGGELYQRPDDCEETIANRLDVYSQQTESLIAHYEDKSILVRIDSDRGVKIVTDDVLAVLKSKNIL